MLLIFLFSGDNLADRIVSYMNEYLFAQRQGAHPISYFCAEGRKK